MAKATIKLIYDKKDGSHKILCDLEQINPRESIHNKNHDRILDELTDELIKNGAVVSKEEVKSKVSADEKSEGGNNIKKSVNV